jgi:hypothetical protein
MDEMQTRMFLAQTGDIISWIGHGNNDLLPDSVRMFAEAIQPTQKAADDSVTSSDSPVGTSTATR